MRIDQEIHNVFQYFKSKDIRWHDFHEVGIEEDYYDYYYAESRLYVIRDRCMSKYYFVKAGSPAEALSKFNGHVEDIASEMSNVDEDEPVGNSEQLEWIPCSERLPKIDEEVLVYLFGDSPHLAWYDGHKWQTDYFTVDDDERPIAWMRLPKPMKGEKDD